MKKILILMLALILAGCSSTETKTPEKNTEVEAENVTIELSDEKIVVSDESAVTLSHDILYYETGHDATYGEGNASEEHTKEEADLHTVITIREPGTYRVSGTLSYGQIAIDLGEDAKKNSGAVVTLVLDGVDLTCTVAPAILVYNAYECASDTKENPNMNVNLTKAGFNLVLENENVISGGHVAKIYKPGTEDKLHKYDAAIASQVSFNIKGDGSLNLTADNEGIETRMHMHIRSGNITINSGDDSLNAGEDGVSVIRISDASVVCNANFGEEGDGIDSNGWVVIEGGFVSATGNEKSMDSGLDSDNGIVITGGTVIATGNMLDSISSDTNQVVLALQSMKVIEKGTLLMVKQGDTSTVFINEVNTSILVVSSPDFTEGTAELWQLESAEGQWRANVMSQVDSVVTSGKYQVIAGTNFGGMQRPGNIQMPQGGNFNFEDMPEGNFGFDGEFNFEGMPEGDFNFGENGEGGFNFGGNFGGEFNFEDMPEGNFDPGNMEIPEGNFDPSQSGRPEGGFDQMPGKGGFNGSSERFKQMGLTGSTEFTLSKGLNQLMLMGIE